MLDTRLMIGTRAYRTEDLREIYAISLATGFAGEDASSLLKDIDLIGHIYAAPYASLKPELTLVAVDEEGVCGYIVGVEDTEAWEHQLEDQWWPDLRKNYVVPDHETPNFPTLDDTHIHMIFNPHRTPAHVVQSYPAHVHLNLLPRIQKQGVGALLLSRWLSLASETGIEAVHVAVNRQNDGGLQFWLKRGFTEIDTSDTQDGTLWLGLRIVP